MWFYRWILRIVWRELFGKGEVWAFTILEEVQESCCSLLNVICRRYFETSIPAQKNFLHTEYTVNTKHKHTHTYPLTYVCVFACVGACLCSLKFDITIVELLSIIHNSCSVIDCRHMNQHFTMTVIFTTHFYL